MLFSSPREATFLSPGKGKKSPEPQYFQGIRRKEEWEKEEERDGFRIRFLRRNSGEKGWKKGRMLFFSLSEAIFLSREKKETQWFQGKEKGKKKEKKDEVLGLEDGIFRGRLEGWREGGREGRRPCKMGVSQGPHFTHLFCFIG